MGRSSVTETTNGPRPDNGQYGRCRGHCQDVVPATMAGCRSVHVRRDLRQKVWRAFTLSGREHARMGSFQEYPRA